MTNRRQYHKKWFFKDIFDDILTKYFSYPTGSAPGGQTALFNKLRTIKDLKSGSHARMTQFMNAARKDLNISKAIQTEAKVLGRAGPLYNHILLSLSEHIRQGGKDFKYIPCLNDNSDHVALIEKLITLNHRQKVKF